MPTSPNNLEVVFFSGGFCEKKIFFWPWKLPSANQKRRNWLGRFNRPAVSASDIARSGTSVRPIKQHTFTGMTAPKGCFQLGLWGTAGQLHIHLYLFATLCTTVTKACFAKARPFELSPAAIFSAHGGVMEEG